MENLNTVEESKSSDNLLEKKKICHSCGFIGYQSDFAFRRSYCIKCHKLRERLRQKKLRHVVVFKYNLGKEFPKLCNNSEKLFN